MARKSGAQRALDNMRQMKAKRGPGWKRWKAGMAAWHARKQKKGK